MIARVEDVDRAVISDTQTARLVKAVVRVVLVADNKILNEFDLLADALLDRHRCVLDNPRSLRHRDRPVGKLEGLGAGPHDKGDNGHGDNRA